MHGVRAKQVQAFPFKRAANDLEYLVKSFPVLRKLIVCTTFETGMT